MITADERDDINYDRIRRMVIAAFSTTDAPSGKNILADYQTKNSKDLQKRSRPPKGMSTEEWAPYKIHAKETKPSGRSKLPFGRADIDGMRLRQKIEKLDLETKYFLNYFYNPSSIGQKHNVTLLIWAELTVLFEEQKRTSETRDMALTMLKELLSCYRSLVMKGVIYRPPTFVQISKKSWDRTFKHVWNDMESIIRSFDEKALRAAAY